MSVTKTGKKKLFRMTVKRKIMLSGIITTLNIKLDSVDEDGLGRLLVLDNDKMTEEVRKEKLMELDSQLQELSLIHDVLEVVCVHEDDVFLRIHMKEDRGWRNEWDVPLEVFNESIDKMIEILRWFQHSKFVHMSEEQFKDYDTKVEFLLELKAFRNSEE
ncbi:hypothetical protein CVD28_01535 [Bacillus sp. M6-12]|uniref:hypothetical protein n=1 Tax=Bacillus sp. M6-12 TaxID=2054166 RepID=UPI000C7807F6|nr:hypothetical protein [Bacillus sp. M6-12]PLS19117.1 hypothetical protein CVD28_01535 [Bacillus sp. M6-12]